MQRDSRSLRCFTVEAHFYRPSEHAAILFGAITKLKAPTNEAYGTDEVPIPSSPFDFIVFPEVFLPSESLLLLATSLLGNGPTGCIHTGIRPDTTAQFLFTRDQTIELANALINLGAVREDLAPVIQWMTKQKVSSYFNLGAVVAVDADGELRAVLHPKVLRSKFELSVFPDGNMTEAKFLTLIKLVPSEPTILPVILQPLLCSDALVHDADFPNGRPIEALSRYGNCFDSAMPDYVDIISLATCTPHISAQTAPLWHRDFREGFLRLAKDDANLRHRHAMILMSNFVEIPDNPRIGGLSGAFLPIPLHFDEQPDYIVAPQFATAEIHLDPAWHTSGSTFSRKFAHMVCLKLPELRNNLVATMLGFDLHRVLKESNQYYFAQGLLKYERLLGFTQPDSTVIFE